MDGDTTNHFYVWRFSLPFIYSLRIQDACTWGGGGGERGREEQPNRRQLAIISCVCAKRKQSFLATRWQKFLFTHGSWFVVVHLCVSLNLSFSLGHDNVPLPLCVCQYLMLVMFLIDVYLSGEGSFLSVKHCARERLRMLAFKANMRWWYQPSFDGDMLNWAVPLLLLPGFCRFLRRRRKKAQFQARSCTWQQR